jgi:hypothetical protein
VPIVDCGLRIEKSKKAEGRKQPKHFSCPLPSALCLLLSVLLNPQSEIRIPQLNHPALQKLHTLCYYTGAFHIS